MTKVWRKKVRKGEMRERRRREEWRERETKGWRKNNLRGRIVRFKVMGDDAQEEREE